MTSESKFPPDILGSDSGYNANFRKWKVNVKMQDPLKFQCVLITLKYLMTVRKRCVKKCANEETKVRIRYMPKCANAKRRLKQTNSLALYFSYHMKKPMFCIRKQGADQIPCNHEVDQPLCVPHMDCTIPLLS